MDNKPKCKCGLYKEKYQRNDTINNKSWEEWRCWNCDYEMWMMSYWVNLNSACRELVIKWNA